MVLSLTVAFSCRGRPLASSCLTKSKSYWGCSQLVASAQNHAIYNFITTHQCWCLTRRLR